MKNINSMKKAELITTLQEALNQLDKTQKAVAQLTASKTYSTPKVHSTDYVNHDKQETKAQAVRETLSPLPASARQLNMFYSKLCTHNYFKFEMPKDLTRKTMAQILNYMDEMPNKTERKLPTEPKNIPQYSDEYQSYLAARTAYYSPKAAACKKLCTLYPEHQNRYKIVYNRYKDPTAYAELDQQDQVDKERYDTFYKKKAPSVIGEHKMLHDTVKVLYDTTVYQADWKWSLDNFIYKA